MGLATIKELDKNTNIVISGRSLAKLEKTSANLVKEGYKIFPFACDVLKKEVIKLAQFSKEKGNIIAIIHAAGVSPHMGDGETILRINALGTHYVDTIFSELMEKDSVIINVSSVSAYMIPDMLLPVKHYSKIFKDENKFLKKFLS